MGISKENKEKLFSKDELDRYRRHISLKNIGLEGQLNLKNSSVIFIGAGGLGSTAIFYAAAAGIGKIGIVDGDTVERSNLQRQIIHNTSEIGNNKTYSAKRRIKALNPNCTIETYTKRINKENILNIIGQYDLICDCSDNFGTRYLVNDACLILNKPFIYGAVQGFEGQVSVFNLNKDSPNLRDLIPVSPDSQSIPSCEEYGVVGVSPGLIGILQANEIIKIIIKKGDILDGKILIFDLLNSNMRKLNLNSNPKYKKIENLVIFQKDYNSSECQSTVKIKKITSSNFKKIYKENFNKILVIDVREKNEFNKCSIEGSISVPLSKLIKNSSFELIKDISKGKEIYTVCQKGKRSEKASTILKKEKIDTISIEGGIEAVKDIKN